MQLKLWAVGGNCGKEVCCQIGNEGLLSAEAQGQLKLIERLNGLGWWGRGGWVEGWGVGLVIGCGRRDGSKWCERLTMDGRSGRTL